MVSKKDVGQTLTDFTDDVGIPDNLIHDGATEMTGRNTKFQREVCRIKIMTKVTESGRHNQNHRAEGDINELKKRWRRRMSQANVPKRLWNFGLVYEAEIMRLIPRGDSKRSGYEVLTGETPDVPPWVDFAFLGSNMVLGQCSWGRTGTKETGRWLGVAHRVGGALCYWVLTTSGKVIARTTVQHVVREDYLQDGIQESIKAFDESLQERLDDTNFVVEDHTVKFYLEDEESTGDDPSTTPSEAEYGDCFSGKQEEAEVTYAEELSDKYVGAELIFDRDGERIHGTVIKRAKGYDGRPVGCRHDNPLFDTHQYVVMFADGLTENYTANVITESMISQVDAEGREYLLLQEIVDHRKDDTAIKVDDGFIITNSRQRRPKITTSGWELCVQWKEGTTRWLKLKDLKESYPVQVAEYAVTNKIAEEPAFKWWVSDVLRK